MTFLLHFIRLCSALLALCGVAALVLWTYFPEKVQEVDDSVTWRYQRASRDKVNRARGLLRTNAEESVAILSSLARKMETYRRGDIHFPRRRVWALTYADALDRVGDDVAAVRVLDSFTAEAPHDIPVALEAIRLLADSEGAETRGQAQDRARLLFEWLPSVPSIARTYLDILADADQGEALEEALLQYLEFVDRPERAAQKLAEDWEIFWAPDKKFNGRAHSKVAVTVGADRMEFRFPIPAGQSFLRIDAPAYSILDLGNPRLQVETESGPLTIPVDAHVGAQGIDSHALGFSVLGELDPWIIVRLPEALNDREFEARFIGDLTLFPAWLRRHLSGPQSHALAVHYAGLSDWKRFGLVRRAWQNDRRARPLQLIAAETTEDATLTVDGSGLTFQVEWRPQGAADHLEVQFPARVGDTIRLSECTVRTSSGEVRHGSDPKSGPFSWDGVRWEGDGGVVLRSDPRLLWHASGEDERAIAWRLGGMLQ